MGRITKQESQKRGIKILLNEMFGRHFEVYRKFAATGKDLHIFFKC